MEIIEVGRHEHVPKPTKIQFKIYRGNKCVFSQVPPISGRVSSVNLAERVIDAICKRKKLKRSKMRFFDLMTRTAYGALDKPRKGMFEFFEVLYDGKKIRWTHMICPAYIAMDFVDHPEPEQIAIGILKHLNNF